MSEPELSPAASAAARPTSRNIFIGPYGLRAGWRLLIFVAMLVVLFFVVGGLAQQRLRRLLGTDFSAPSVIIGELFSFVLVVVATFIMSKIEHRRFAAYGIPAHGFLGKNFWMGALWGFVMLSVIVACMAATRAYAPGGLALSPAGLLKYGFLWAVAFLMVGFFEEFSFRGYLQYTLTSGIGFWPAALLTCLLFAGAHRGNPGESWVGVVEIVLIALFLCMALRRTGNLWFAIGWHMSFDWGESFFYSTPNSGIQATGHMLKAHLTGSKWFSGGSVGPEATVFDLIVTAIGILLLMKFYPQAKYPEISPEEAIAPEIPPAITLPPPAPSQP